MGKVRGFNPQNPPLASHHRRICFKLDIVTINPVVFKNRKILIGPISQIKLCSNDFFSLKKNSVKKYQQFIATHSH